MPDPRRYTVFQIGENPHEFFLASLLSRFPHPQILHRIAWRCSRYLIPINMQLTPSDQHKVTASSFLKTKSKPGRCKMFAIPILNRLLFFNISDIINLEVRSNYSAVYFLEGSRLLASRTLKEFEELLPQDTFFRAHHSHIINLQYIKRYIRGDGGQIEMQNGHLVDLARRKKEEFLRLIS